MQYKSIKIGLFVLLALVQLYIPANMIWQQQKTITQGKAYRFETAPVDPNDPFRGKYITLRFTAEDYSPEDWDAIPSRGKINVLLGEDENGLAKVIGLQSSEPEAGVDYFKAEIGYKNKSRQIVSLYFPFDKFYMEESKAYEAELAHRRARRDSSQLTYALVMVRDGETALEDVIIDGVSIKEVVESVQD
ncbi:MAG: GDYXXLXY domain-containing protein [Bacteroidota bacterium]